jgi:hypothetical protein
MECVFSLNRVLNCLARVGDELLVEAVSDKVSNSRRSTTDVLHSLQA